jgi:predicted DsbA family dithiol-disulfide isomerase
MSASGAVTVQYFSDLLCVWAYIGQARLDELEAAFGSEIATDVHFVNVFGEARDKLAKRWQERGGLAAYAAHVRQAVARFEHVTLHEDVWTKVQPVSSLGCHVFLAAVKLTDRERFRMATWALRQAFFRDALDIAERQAQLAVAERIGLDVAAIERELYTGRAHAELSRGLDLARVHGVEVSPTYVFDEGRQRLSGNVGYRVIEANVRELLRAPDAGHSWC